MINGVKIHLVYHLYCKNVQDMQVGGGNVYNEINRRCLEHFHGIFDDAVFCVCLDDTGDSELVQKAAEWIWSCGFKDNVTIKVKPNSPYRDAQTFYDEVVNHLSEFSGMVFFGHNKGNTQEYRESIKQWIIFSYYSCLDKIEEHVTELASNAVAYTYVPVSRQVDCKWLSPGTLFLFNPRKIVTYLGHAKRSVPKMDDRFAAETFLPKIIDITAGDSFLMDVMFDECRNMWFNSEELFVYELNHVELISYFLSTERVEKYKHFYETITEGL